MERAELLDINGQFFAKQHLQEQILSSSTDIGIKIMGEIDVNAFIGPCKENFGANGLYVAAVLCSLWQEYVKDPMWYPFKIIIVNGRCEDNPSEKGVNQGTLVAFNLDSETASYDELHQIFCVSGAIKEFFCCFYVDRKLTSSWCFSAFLNWLAYCIIGLIQDEGAFGKNMQFKGDRISISSTYSIESAFQS